MAVLRDRVVLVLLVLVLAGSVLSVLLAIDRPASGGDSASVTRQAAGSDLPGPGGDALDTAVAVVPAAFAYDHGDLDGSLASATATMTPRYARVYTRAFDRRVRPLATRQDAVVEGLVRGAGVVRADGDEAVACLLYVDQVLVRGRGLPSGSEPEVLARIRVRVDLVLRDDTWLVAGIRAV